MKLTLKQSLLILFLLVTPLFLSLLPFFIQSYLSPPDRVFMGLHRWSEDYYGYLQSISQGLMGHLSNVSKLTLEPHEATFVHSEYVLLGFIGRFFGLNSVLIYHLSRLVLGAIFVFLAFYFFYFVSSCHCEEGAKRLTKQSSTLTRLPRPFGARNDRIWFTIIAFFLAFFVGGLPLVSFSSSSSFPLPIPNFLSPLLWWTELDVLTRSTILPHYLMGNILFLLIIILFIRCITVIQVGMTGRRDLFLLFLCSFFLSFTHPIDFLILICSLGLFVVFQLVLNLFFRLQISLIRPIGLIFIIFLSGLLPTLYYRYVLSLPFWRFILAHGTTTPYNIPLFDLIMALGPVFFLAIFGIAIVLFCLFKKNRNGYSQAGGDQRGAPKLGSPCGNIFGAVGRQDPSILLEPVFLLLFSWLFTQALFFLKLYEIFNFDRLRTMQAPYYIALSFFSTFFLIRIYERFKNHFQKLKIQRSKVKTTGQNSKLSYFLLFNFIFDFCLLTFALLTVLASIPTTVIGLRNQIYSVSNFKTFSLFSYPTIKQYQAWQFLRDHTPDNSVITALYEAKFLIPTVSGNKIAFGANFDNDPSYNENVNKINKFYQGILSPQDTYNFFLNNSISYVYWGYQEQSLAGNLTQYPFLEKIFANGEVTVFKVK